MSTAYQGRLGKRLFVSALSAFVVFVMVATSFMAVMASAESDPEVWTDSDEYAPGETVYLFGDGFVKWVPVSIELEHPDLGTKFFTATPAIDGSFVFDGYRAEWVENVELPVNVTVTQELSTGTLVATTVFYDPGAFIEGYTLAPHLRWTMGDIKGYNEGDSVPFSVILSSQHLGDIGSITIHIGFDYVDMNSPTNPTYGIDYLTEFPVDPWDGPYNTYPLSDEPFTVEDDAWGEITDQGWVEDVPSDEGENQWIRIYGFTVDLTPGYDTCIVRFGAHLALSEEVPSGLGASYYPGSALHVRMVMTDPETNEGHRDVPIMLGDVLIPPKMTLEKECDPEIVVQGDEITFELTWSNVGQAYASCLVFHDDLPEVVDIDPTSFLYWTSANPTPLPAYPMPTVSGDTWDWSLGYWPGTGADGCTPPLIGHLSFTATVNTNVPGWYYNWANLTFQDNHGGYYPPVVAWCKFQILSEPSIMIEKVGPEYAHVGDLITYDYTVTNTGDVDLKEVTIDDPLIDSDPLVIDETLAVGETKVFHATYTVLETDDDPLPNTATVTAEDDFCRTTTDDDSWEVDILHPDILVSKTVDPECAKPGEEVTYHISVVNPSEDTDLYGVTVVDSMFGTWVIGTLLAESTYTFDPIVHMVTTDDGDPVVNTVTAEGEDLLGKAVSAEASATVEVYHPDIQIVKVSDVECAAVGDVVEYTITVTNPSWDTTMWAHVTDSMLCLDKEVELAPYESEVWVLEYLVTVNTPDPLVNTAYVEAHDIQDHFVRASSTWTIDIYHPMIEVTKVGSLGCAAAGDEITYWINVTNPSTDTLMTATVTDLMFGGVVWSGDIAPKGVVPLVFTHMVVLGETDPLVNEVTVTAVDPQGHTADDSARWSVDIYHPAIEVDKSADKSCAMLGETIVYTITVTAPNDDTEMYVEVYDSMFGGCLYEGWILGGKNWSESYKYTVAAEYPDPLVNEVWVEAWDLQDHHVSAYDSWSVDIYHPAIEILKIADLECAGVGDVITYTIFITNPSDDTPLPFVQVSDDMFGGIIWTGSLDSLESVILKMPLLTHTVTVDDKDPIENTATVYAKDPQNHEVRASSTWSVDFVHPDVMIDKVADEICAAVGEEVTYTITVTNPQSADVWLNGTVTDDMLGQTWTFTNLMPGDTLTYIYTMRMPDIDPFINTATVVAYDHQDHEVTASDSWKVDVVHPDVEITKTADLTCAAVDEDVTYTIIVTNPASTDVWLNGTVYDDTLEMAWKFSDLKPGEFIEYKVTVAMPDDADPFMNTAHVVAYDHQFHEVTDKASWSVDVVHPEIFITKEGSLSCAAVGESVTYRITVQNPEWADVWLNGTVTDDMLGQTWTFTNLMPGDTLTYIYTMRMPDIDPFINTATVVAYDHQLHMVDGEASWKVDVVHPDIEVTKTTDDVVCAHEGETITYLITVTVPADCDVWMNGTVYDDDLGWSASFSNLRPGHSVDWKVDYLVTAATPDPFTNHVHVEAVDHQFHLVTDDDSWTVDILHPEILVTKVGPEKADIGETITYYVTVTNTGDTPLYEVQVDDSLVGTLATYAVLEIGETGEIYYTYVVPAGTGTLDNIVTAIGVDKQGIWVDDTAEWTVFKYGIVTGYKFVDVDQDSFMDTSEPGVLAWMVVLSGMTASGDPVYETRLTDSFGYYEFKSVDAGTYTVSEVMLSGWFNTLPISSAEFDVGSGTSFSCDFANVPTGSISGYKWRDVDIDGIWDAGELGIPGWTIFLTGYDASGEYMDLIATTDANGYYEFVDLLPGIYDVSEETVDGWFATAPVLVHVDVSALVPFEITDVDFGNAKYGSITGFKWLDEYMNGYRDANEPLLPGWTIVLVGTAVDGTEIGPIETVTDENGYYAFENLLPGEYTVSEVLQPGWYAVTPSSYDLTLLEGSEITCAKFGNVEYSEINGWKFLDWDMDGAKDGDNPGIPGWEITIEGWLNDGKYPGPVYPFEGCTHIGPITITTDANGYWMFDDLLPGVYIVTEASVEGWYHTTDPSVTLTVTSGSYLYDIKFGNVPYMCLWGYKVNDTNGDGRWGEGELGIPGWTVIVEGVRNDGAPVYFELTTDEKGYWATCYNVLPGTYWVYEVLQDGWMPTTPCEVLFEPRMTMDIMDYEFVFMNFELGKISGYKYEDMNGNGVLDAGDMPLPGWTITLSGPMSMTTTTDSDGYYEFDGLLYGTYTVTEEARARWVAMTPTYYTVDIMSGSDVSLDPFLNVELCKIWGYKFEDMNSNGVWDPNELGIGDWTIYMMWDNDMTVYSTTTGPNGYYEFDMLMPNEYYLVWEELREGWTPTTDAGALVSLQSGDWVEIPSFGNFHNVDITVFKYEDVNSNGVFDKGDNPLPGWSIVVSGPGVPGGVVTLVTDEFGYASVEVTAAGTYIVEELMQAGWCNILPVVQYADVVSGYVDPEIVMFGNFECVTITLFKYEDMDSNGIFDGDDIPLSGWTFYLDSLGGAHMEVVTGADGTVDVTFCRADVWTVTEENREGWCMITPEAGYYTFSVYSGFVLEDQYRFEFGNFQCVTIIVFKYWDKCSNGWYDPDFGDEPIARWYMELFGPDGELLESGYTDEDGYITWTVCAAGTYVVVEEDRDGWSHITPLEGYYEIEVLSGDREMRAWFGNYLDVEVPIFKYEDVNSNGVFDEGDKGVPGWYFELVRDDGTVYSGYTDECGWLVLMVNRSGMYTVYEELRADWTPINPASGMRLVNIVSGTQVPVQEFGNFHDVTITVFKFEDMNGDGRYDAEVDRPLADWEFVVTGPWSGSGTVIITDMYGYASIVVDRAGWYCVDELVQPGWTPTTSTHAEMFLASGCEPNTVLFGNFKDIELRVFKYEDVNSDGMYDPDVDKPLPGWTIELYSDEYGFLVGTTGADGFVTFVLHGGGMWYIAEYLEIGWCQITPELGWYEYYATSGDVPDVYEFGNFRCVTIDVFKYEDKNSNGVFDGDDAPVGGWYFELLTSAGALYAYGWTDETGHVYFYVCHYDLWTVVEENREGWTHINPECGSLTVETQSSSEPATLEFGNFRDVWIVVFKYHDRNSNGAYDGTGYPGSDDPIEGWLFSISGPGVTDVAAYTDAYGYAYFRVVRAGTYTITEADDSDWVHVNPVSGVLQTTVVSGDQPDVLEFGNFKLVEIRVFKYDDILADGRYTPDDGDAPLEGWMFELYIMVDDEWVLVDVQYTDEYGYAYFVIDRAGFYMVKEELPTGWRCITHDGGTTDFLVLGGNEFDVFMFGNFKLGKIFGWKWNDLNGNGLWDTGEPALSGWKIWFECTSPYYLTGWTVTNENGYYEFTGLPSGEYVVWEVGQSGWVPTAPPEAVVEIIGHTEARLDFFNFQLGCITGYKYEDMNGDGVLDKDDVPLERWTIYLLDVTGKLIAMTVTDANGFYSFCGLGPGTYVVSEEARTGWIATNEASESVVMTSGATIVVHTFLNFELGCIYGYKFEDTNSNGVWDDGEEGIEDWEINMMIDSIGYDVTYTDADGRFVFDDLMGNWYLIWEAMDPDWTATTVDWALVTIYSGDCIEVPAFGNFHNVDLTLFKYEDVDGNGLFNGDDEGIEGWMFTVTGPCFDTPLVVYTDADGYAYVTLTAAGEYLVVEEDRANWMHVVPDDGTMTVDVLSGDMFKPLMFGNFMLGQITGKKFYDWNKNGVMDGGEYGLAGWVIWVNGTLVGGGWLNFTRITDSTGSYSVTGLPAGTYAVSERLEYAAVGWTPMTPTSVPVGVSSGTAASVSFGNVVFGVIEGYKFYDKNLDGWMDEDEPGLGGWTIVLEGYTDAGAYVYRTVTTDGTGKYVFNEVQPGVYDVYEVLWPDWAPTTPLPVHVSVAGAMVYFDIWVNIGNVRYATVFGYKFQDLYGDFYPYWPNGVFDEGEWGIGNWEITLQGWTTTGVYVDRVVYTDNSEDIGYYQFGELLPGTYWVNETLLEHWYATRPISNMIVIYPFPMGQVKMRIDFGNTVPDPDPEVNFVLKKGANLWSSPLEMPEGLSASELASAIGPSVVRISVYDTVNKTYISYVPGFKVDFEIELGEGYLVIVRNDVAFTLEGVLVSEGSAHLDRGVNIMGYTEMAPITASELASNIAGAKVYRISYYDTVAGKYVSFVPGFSQPGGAYDFTITQGRAYLVITDGAAVAYLAQAAS